MAHLSDTAVEIAIGCYQVIKQGLFGVLDLSLIKQNVAVTGEVTTSHLHQVSAVAWE